MRYLWQTLNRAFVAATVALLLIPAAARAQPPQNACPDTAPTTYHPAAGDTPAYIEIACPFAGSASDRVYAYDRNGDMRDTGSWRSAADFTNDFWVFDAGGNGRANLLIDFHPSGGALVADLYDDQNGDAAVDYHFEGGRPVIGESRFWTVEVTAKDGWWQRDGVDNFNLDIAIDGMVIAMPITTLDIYRKITRHDGTPDQLITVRDPQHQGKPDLDMRVAPSAEGYGVVKTAIMKDYGVRAVPMQPGIFWPYLGSAYGPPTGSADNVMMLVTEYAGDRAYGLVRAPNSFPAPIQMIWAQSKISYLGEFTPSRVANSRFIYSIRALTPNDLSYLDFENPYDYYDLAQANDGFQDLQVRFESYPAHDENYQQGKLADPSTLIRYSWDMDHDHRWDFKLSLTGRHAVDTAVEYNGYQIQSLTHDAVPYWVTERPWDVAQFVQAETGYESTEGIYTWDTLKMRDAYISGLRNGPDASELQTIPPLYRGEYAVDLHAQPYLYFSPVDRKLHMLKAQQGLWNVDGDHEIRTSNLGGEYINEWLYRSGGSVLESLHVAAGYLIYADANSIRLVRADVPPALFTTLPPRNHAEWASLGQQLAAYPASFAPGDFKAMQAQFSGPASDLSNASLRDFRLVGSGFRFVLELKPGFALAGDAPLALDGLQPGAYAVAYDGAFHIEPLTPPALAAQITVQAPQQLASAALRVALRNDGREDMPASTLELWATPPQGSATLVTTQTVALLAGQTITATANWMPALPGEWQIAPRLLRADGQSLPLGALGVQVQPAASTAPQVLVSRSSSASAAPLIALTLLGFAAIAALAFQYSWRQALQEPTNNAE
ncbi:MAG TPA: hypothetical protein PKK15_08810 [Kouleothrix sp.]|uniref:hypothetical protein n=1 Tax=Kouleothrix sp. TaxID=2779161 RepID=UPI002B8E09E0|nr:hypothetical protein [Kouleothrix sp.]